MKELFGFPSFQHGVVYFRFAMAECGTSAVRLTFNELLSHVM